ncbi:MAG: hypothetical protein LRY50_05100 [Geovibrio sp.]|nr:hypothetical protein [Geovibrio sp.]
MIHVAGTNGKGSTCRFTADMLKACGHKTALFTSPHILKVNERIVSDGRDISDADFDRIFAGCVPLIEKYRLSYFEALTLIAFMYFSELKPDFSVIETGMGGRFDSSNVLNVKLPVITAIAKDHAAFLGNSIYRIADEKLAIIKDNRTVMLGMNTPSVTEYIRKALPDKKNYIHRRGKLRSACPLREKPCSGGEYCEGAHREAAPELCSGASSVQNGADRKIHP